MAQGLKTKLLPGEHTAEQSERPPSGNLEAYNALLQGRFYGSRSAEADVHKAIEFYTRATELDPRYAAAYAGCSSAYGQMYWLFSRNAAQRERAARVGTARPESTSAGVIACG